MANVLSLLKPTAQPSMNGFDLSQKHVYSSAPGRIDSPLQVEVVPKDKFQINVASMMRTMTLQRPAFLRGKITYDFYFVPYSQLWHPFNQFVDQRKDVHSSRQLGMKYVPVISLYALFYLIRNMFIKRDQTFVKNCADIHGISWFDNVWRLLDYFGYGNYYWLKDLIESDASDKEFGDAVAPYEDKYVNIFRPAAYQHVWYDYYRNKFYDNYEYQESNNFADYVLCFNFDDIQCDTFAHSVVNIDGTLANYDCADNQRIIMLFTQRYVQFKQDLFQSALPSTQFGVVSSVSMNLDLSATTTVGNNTLYRDIDGVVMSEGDESSVAFGDGDLLGSTTDPSETNVRAFHKHGAVTSISNQNVSFDVIALKRAEALQKWRQNALRAGNMVDDSFRAHFGVTPQYEADNYPKKLGSFEGTLDINAVEATAATGGASNGQVGDLGASATGVIRGNKIQSQFSDFGVIVCFNYFRPESEYSAVMIDRANRLNEPFDFFTEEFMNTGLDAIDMADFDANLPYFTSQLGFASQYWWYKQAVDKVHGTFAKYLFQRGQLSDAELYKGNTTMWVAPRLFDYFTDRLGFLYRNLSSLYVSPRVLDDVFGIKYQEDIALPDDNENKPHSFITDPFHFNCYFDIKAIRPMSVVGLPNF